MDGLIPYMQAHYVKNKMGQSLFLLEFQAEKVTFPLSIDASSPGMPRDHQACNRKREQRPRIRRLSDRPEPWCLAVAIPLQDAVVGRARPTGDGEEPKRPERYRKNQQ